MNKMHYSEHQKHQQQQQNIHQSMDEKRSYSLPFDRFLHNSKNYDNNHYGRFEGPHQQQQQQQQHHNLPNKNNSKFMSFFAREGIEKNNSSSSLNEFFKQASSNNNNNNQSMEQPKSLNYVNQMPSVDQLEAKWRRNSLGNVANEALSPVPNNTNNTMNTNKQNDNFQKLIGALNGAKVQQQQQGLQTPVPTPPQVGNDAISNFIMQQQQYQQQQQKQHMLIQQQQQQTAFLASLQLKAILGRADTQLLLVRLTKGKCCVGSLFHLQSEI